MMAEVGIKLNLKPMEDTEPTRQSGEWDWLFKDLNKKWHSLTLVIGQKWVL